MGGDTFLLIDAFENFCVKNLKTYQTDPCHIYSAPILSYIASLKKDNLVLELLMVEKKKPEVAFDILLIDMPKQITYMKNFDEYSHSCNSSI